MSDLTEQWNKGKLSDGDYYIKRINGLVLYDNIDSHGVWRNSVDEEIAEVLTPVPSYEEWQTSYNCMLENEVLRLKNAQLKELLKRARGLMDYTKDWACNDATEKMILEINEALGDW